MKFKEVPTIDRAGWLQWRHKGIGSSDVPVILGTSRFKKRDELILEKAGICQEENDDNKYIKDRGNRIETLVRTMLEHKMGTTLNPLSVEMINFPFIRASLDGITPDRKMFTEIKLLSSQKPDKVNKNAEGYIKWENARKGEVPKEYMPQIQHQLFVTGAPVCLFLGYREVLGQISTFKDNVAMVEVTPDSNYIKLMIDEECKFWYDVEVKRDELNYKGELE